MSTTKKLSQLSATAICGNDITSSCLYVSALTIVYAGQYAWIALLLVAWCTFFIQKNLWRSSRCLTAEWGRLQRATEYYQ